MKSKSQMKAETQSLEKMYEDLFKQAKGMKYSSTWYENDDDECEDDAMRTSEIGLGVSLPLEDGNIELSKGCVMISPSDSGFMVFTNPEGDKIEIHCFGSYEAVLEYLTKNTLMDLTETEVAENI